MCNSLDMDWDRFLLDLFRKLRECASCLCVGETQDAFTPSDLGNLPQRLRRTDLPRFEGCRAPDVFRDERNYIGFSSRRTLRTARLEIELSAETLQTTSRLPHMSLLRAEREENY